MKAVVWTFLLWAAPCVRAQQDHMTVSDLHTFCTSSREAEKTACSFYIWGVTEGAGLVGSTTRDSSGVFREAKDKRFCMPAGVSKRATDVIVRMKIGEELALFPADGDLPAVSVVVAILTKQFPCGRAK